MIYRSGVAADLANLGSLGHNVDVVSRIFYVVIVPLLFFEVHRLHGATSA